ncbi:MAG: hypothetical protein HYS25_04345 [Ignavibacteriales bacterium]|nr:hypothetical protein [Ignavibacteriales bacterium]
MSGINSFNISFETNFFIALVSILLLIAYSIYIYKYTVPKVSFALRIFLLSLRAVIVILVLLLIFEPLITLTFKETQKQFTYLFVDNSQSMIAKESASRSSAVKKLVDDVSANQNDLKIFSFGKDVNKIEKDSIDKINFSELLTDFSKIFSSLGKSGNASSAIIVSDGIITNGTEPYYTAEKLGFPVYTIGIGDTTKIKDAAVRDVIYNQYIYKNRPTEIEAVITSFGYENQNARIVFYDEGKVIGSKDIVLSASGINRVKFDYNPDQSGERKLNVIVTPLANESNKTNNSRTFFINVLETKIKITVVAGAPSADLSATTQALASDKNLEVKKIVQVSSGKFWDNLNLSLIDSADILFLVDFPSARSPKQLLDKVQIAVQNNKPFYIEVSANTDYRLLKNFERALPFSIGTINYNTFQAQPDLVSTAFTNAFSGAADQINIWQNLPPVTKSSSNFPAKPESNVLIKSKVRNLPVASPLMISRAVANQRSIAMLAGEIWQWNLSTTEKHPGFFNNFINDIVKWLYLSDQQKQFVIRTNKKIFSYGEQVEFTAELYDQTFTPVDSAQIELTIKKQNEEHKISFEKVNSGVYQAFFDAGETGDYTFGGTAKFNGSLTQSNSGRFTITDAQIELLDTRMNIGLLQQLAQITSGKYFPINNYFYLLNELKRINKISKDKSSYTEIELWSNEWIMILIICLFAIEWFIRKRTGML